MIGSKTLFFTGDQFGTGSASNTYGTDGFFGNDDSQQYGLNLTYRPGVILGMAKSVDKTGSLTGNIVASCWDPSQGHKQIYVTDSGKVFTWDGSALTERRDSTGTYEMGTTDMVVYKDYLYMTSTNNVHRIPAVTNYATSIDETWWSVTAGAFGTLNTSNRHPMIVFENALWIGDGNLLHKWDGTTASKSFLTLPAGQNIVTMNIDPNSGKLLISITEGDNPANLLPVLAKILVFDGYSNKPTRAVIVDEMVTAIYALGGVVYMAYGQNLGYWNGSGITFLRKFRNVTNSQSYLVYKAKISSLGKTLLIADGVNILAYGEIFPGRKVFYPFAIDVSGSQIKLISSVGSGVLGIAVGTAAFSTIDTTSIATTSGVNFYTRKFFFPKKVQLREVTITTMDPVAAATNFANLVAITQQSTYTMSPLTNGWSDASYELTSNPISTIPPARFIQLQFQGVADKNYGITSIKITYDELE